MTPEEQEMILALAEHTNYGTGTVTPETVLNHFGADDGEVLGLRLLRDAMDRKDADDAEMALIVSAIFSVGNDYLDSLIRLCRADWHHDHENAVSALAELHAPEAVDVLLEMTQLVPDYLEFDEARALAVKAIWALGKTPGEAAEAALQEISNSDNEIAAENARMQLERRARQ